MMVKGVCTWKIFNEQNLSEFDEWVQNGIDKAEEIIKDTAEK